MSFKYPLLLMFLLSCTAIRAQKQHDSLTYQVEVATTIVPKGTAPLWLVSNRHGLSTLDDASGYARFGVTQSPMRIANSEKWNIGYGVDVVFPINHTSICADGSQQRTHFLIQQCHVDVDYKWMRLSVGSKERPMALKNQRLSSGSQTFGINARPVPDVRFEIPEYVSLTGKENPWIAIKGHFGYGMMTDGQWKKSHVARTKKYNERTLLHSKAGYLKIGNPERFPLVFEGGLEMAAQFGGVKVTGNKREKMPQGVKDFMEVIFGLGSDASDGNFPNAAGNTLGSWLFSLTYQAKDWSARAYYDHYFDDHSMLFFQYGWYDGLLGLEITMPANKWVNSVVYEYMKTTYQGGPVYHDHTPQIPDQISGMDNYYNHGSFPGWQHWGQAIGNPLYTSPLYSANGSLGFRSNRFTAHHLGIEGAPITGLNYRLLLSYATHLGTYGSPYLSPKYMTSGLAELNYNFAHIHALRNKGWFATIALGVDRGQQLGNNIGFSFSLKKAGLLLK